MTKDQIYYAIMDFLETHKVSELIEIIQYCIQSDENRKQ